MTININEIRQEVIHFVNEYPEKYNENHWNTDRPLLAIFLVYPYTFHGGAV